MRTKIYLLLIALVTTIGSVWGQASAVQVADGNGLYYLLDRPVAGEATVGYDPAFTGYDINHYGLRPPFNTVANVYTSSSVTIPTTISKDGATYRVTTIGSWAFAGSALTSVIIPEGIETLNIASFSFCESLETVRLPTTLKSIAYSSFRGSVKLRTITMPNDGVYFKVRDNLLLNGAGDELVLYPPGRTDTEYTLPNDLTLSLDHHVFQYATHLEKVILHDGVTKIPNSCFINCFNLTEVIIPSSVTEIDSYAFEGTAIRTIDIPESVTYLGFGVFTGCEELQSVNILSSDIIFGNRLFNNCPSLESITVLGEIPPVTWVDIFGDSSTTTDITNITLHIPKGAGDNYNIYPWNTLGIISDDFYLVIYKNEGVTYLTETYPASAEYRLTEPTTPTRTGYTFDGWYDASGKVIPFDATKYGINNTITARWAAITLPPPVVVPTYTITIESLAGVTVNKPEGGTVDEGRPFSFTATPDAGYTVTVYVNRTEHAPASDNFYLIEGIDEDKTVTFALAGTYAEGSVVGGITINGEPLDDKKTDFSEEGKIVITFNDDADTNVSGKVIIDGKEVSGTWGTDSNGNPTYTIDYAVTGDGEHTIKIEGFGGDGETHTFTTGGGSGNNNNNNTGGKIVIDGSTPDLGGGFPPTGEIVVYPPVVTYPETPTVTIDGEDVTGTWETDEDGNPIYVIDYNLEDGGHTIVIDGEEFTFEIDGNGVNGNNGNTGGKVVIDETTPPNLPGEFPGGGIIVVCPPVINYPEIPSVTIDGKEVVPGGTWGTDDNGKPIFVIEYEDLEDGEHTIVVNGKEYTFTVKNGGATSNTILSTTKVVAGNGTISVSVAQPTLVQIVSISGAVVYSANVASETVVSLAQGLYIVKAGASSVKVVVR